MPLLRPGNVVDVVAPSSGADPDIIQKCLDLLASWGLTGRIPDDTFGDDPFFSNTKDARARCLLRALTAPDSTAVWCLRGGSGATSLLPHLLTWAPPPQKLFLGFSDATFLHLFFYQKWGWSSLHCSTLKHLTDFEDAPTLEALEQVLFTSPLPAPLSRITPLNEAARTSPKITGALTGGNLSLLQTSIGTPWQIATAGRVVFVEDVDEKPYRTLERLTHLQQAGLFENCAALIFFDFTYNTPVEEKHYTLYPKMLSVFGDALGCPVFKGTGVGHGPRNLPLWIGKDACLERGTLTFI